MKKTSTPFPANNKGIGISNAAVFSLAFRYRGRNSSDHRAKIEDQINLSHFCRSKFQQPVTPKTRLLARTQLLDLRGYEMRGTVLKERSEGERGFSTLDKE